MPRGDKSKYTDKQERKADHIAESYEKQGVTEKEAERRAWATVNKNDGGGKKPGPAAASTQAILRCTRAKTRRKGIGFEIRRRTFSLSQEGGGDGAQAQRRASCTSVANPKST